MTVFPTLGLADPFSCISHVVGALVCVPCSWLLLRSEMKSRAARIAVGTFCFACTFLLLASGVFHLLPHESEARVILQRIDHAAIFMLIAATFTPVHALMFKGFWRWAPLVLVWTVAVVGMTAKAIFFTAIPEVVSTSIYLGMGWFGAVSGGMLCAQYGFAFISPLLSGAVCYTAGAVFDLLRTPVAWEGVIGPHELFHLTVLSGIAFHWKFVKRLLLHHSSHVAVPVAAD